MKILYLSAYSAPEKAASSYLGANRNQAFVDAGFRMVNYSPVPTRGVSRATRKEYLWHHRREERFDGKFVLHRFYLMPESKHTVQRFLRYFLQDIKQFNRAVFHRDARSCDLLFLLSTPPLHGAMGALVSKVRHIPFVYNLQDIFPDSLVGTGLTRKGSLLWRIGRKIEDFTYRNADRIIVISEDFKRNILAKGVPEEKIEVIYNWVDEEAVVDVPRSDNVLLDRYGLDPDKFYVTYCGNIGLTQNMDLLLDVAQSLQVREPAIQFVLVGEGADKARVEAQVAVRGLQNVTLLPFQPYEDISHVFSLGDASLVISKPGVGENSVPSKTWSILSASRPVIASFDENELRDIIRDHSCGLFVPAGDKEALEAAVLDLFHHPEKAREFGRNGRRFILENLTRAVGTRKYVDVIKSFEK